MAPVQRTHLPVPYSLEVLFQLVPDRFDSDEFKMRHFLRQVDEVFKLAHESQKTVLLLFVKKRVTECVQITLDIHELKTWQEVSQLLIQKFYNEKPISDLLLDLKNMKQAVNEPVLEFYQRLKDHARKTKRAMYAAGGNQNEIQTRLSTLKHAICDQFTKHTRPELARVMKHRKFDNLDDALFLARREERTMLARTNSIRRLEPPRIQRPEPPYIQRPEPPYIQRPQLPPIRRPEPRPLMPDYPRNISRNEYNNFNGFAPWPGPARLPPPMHHMPPMNRRPIPPNFYPRNPPRMPNINVGISMHRFYHNHINYHQNRPFW